MKTTRIRIIGGVKFYETVIGGQGRSLLKVRKGVLPQAVRVGAL